MPNPGGLYRGCGACRSRKVKCDQTFPSCRQCVKSRIDCPGVRRMADVMFRDETSKVLQKVAHAEALPCGRSPSARAHDHASTESTRGKPSLAGAFEDPLAPNISDDISAPKEEFLVSNSVSARPDSPAVLTNNVNSLHGLVHVSLPGVEILTQYLFDQIVMPETWLSLLPPLYSHSRDNGALRCSIHAASLFLMANQSGDHTAMARARRSYGRCLSLLNIDLGHHAEKLKDETFCTILVLHLINDIAGERSLSSGSHLKACNALLLQRNNLQHPDSNNCKIANSLVIQSQAYVLKYYEDCSELYAEQVCCCASAQPAARVLRQCLAIGKLRSTVANLRALGYEHDTATESHWFIALREAQAIDLRFDDWEHDLTERWHRKTATHKLSSVLEVNVDFYSDIQVGKVWNQYRCARIVLHEVIIEILENLIAINTCSRHELVYTIKQSAQTITTMLSAICDSIPFHLQQVDSNGRLVTLTSQRVLGGEHLLWPLDVVFRSQWSNEYQRSQARKALEEIGTCFGLRQASISIQHGDVLPNLSNALLDSNLSPQLA
ncbi:hypothetical protein PV04_02807 [Phialophora macrospora]|uniref:Zn(2)-C6 fungal-type domain-containing protein n=1 Tax=Phialophora macrospora TaxID=1851006 RepID=A0A0D2GEH9_9EURO|nr:hypothetical protein PV04_02807 [Phialophora macrospora]